MIELILLPSKALKITVAPDGKQWLAERLADGRAEAEILRDLLEPYWANGAMHPFSAGDGSPYVGLTDAPCIAEAMDVAEDGSRSVVGKLWWFPQYERVGPLDTLVHDGSVIFSLAPEDTLRLAHAQGRSAEGAPELSTDPVDVATAARQGRGHQSIGTHASDAPVDGASPANVADELGQAQADDLTAICRSTITFQVLHDAAAIPLLVNPHLNYIAHECDAGDWIGGRLHVSTSPALTRDQLVAACGELGGNPDFFSDASNDDGDFPAMTAFMSTHEALLGELASQVAAIGGPDGVLEEKLDDAADELKGRLGADAANQQESREDQEEAISQAEAWVAEHVSNGSLADRLSAVLWLQGEVGARQLVEAARERFFSNAVQRPRC